MNAISAASVFTDIESRIVQDVKPWEKSAYKVQWFSVFRSYDLLPEAPLDIDVFEADKNRANNWARYSTFFELPIKPCSLKNALKRLENYLKMIAVVTSDSNDSKAFKVKVDLLNEQSILASFPYVVKW